MVRPKVLIPPVQIASTDTQYYNTPFQMTTIIKKLTLTNNDPFAVARHVTIWIATNGAATTPANMLMQNLNVGPGETVDVTQAINQVMGSLDAIHALCDQPNAVTIRASGVELT